MWKVLFMALPLLGYLSFHSGMYAQARKTIAGRVLDQEATRREKKPIPFNPEKIDVRVYYLKTVSEAEDLMAELSKENISVTMEASYEIPDPTGFYAVQVPENGALVIKVGIGKPVLEKVNGRLEITTQVDAGIVLETVNVIGISKVVLPMEATGEQYGNVIYLNNVGVNVPQQIGKNNARMIIQPYVVNNSRNKELTHYRLPKVYDGEQYDLTQERRMGYDMENDSLLPYIQETVLTTDKAKYTWNDTVVVPNTKDNFQVFAKMQVEDYLGPYYSDSLPLSTRCPRKPLKFLEYSLNSYDLDPKKYEERPKRELRTGVENISLSFLVGKAELDPNDPNNDIQLNKLKEKLLNIINGESSTLKELHLSSVSSPEGAYAFNAALSQRRLAYARSLVYSVIPAYTMKRLYTFTPNDSRVASWTELADILEQDSLLAEAAAVREIAEKYPKSRDTQSIQVKKLPFYDTVIKERLTKLRTMKCEYQAEIYRALTPDEIMYRYKNDPDYRSGKKQFELYEYWNLFNMVKDPKELEELYKRAYDYSIEISPDSVPWVLAANNLASSYLKRDTFDVKILDKLIDRSVRRCNVERRMDGRLMKVVNVEEVVANQLAMYLKAEDFANASVMAQILPDTERNDTLKAYAFCLGGYYKASPNLSLQEIDRRKRTFSFVKNSTPVNGVVMCLAMNQRNYNEEAERLAKKLPADDPLTHYLRAIIYMRMDNDYMAGLELVECFKRDEKYISIAESDGDIREETFKDALDTYKADKEASQKED